MTQSDERGRERAKAVKAAMKHAWDGYVKYAFGGDELGPISRRKKENWGGMGVTLVDSLGERSFPTSSRWEFVLLFVRSIGASLPVPYSAVLSCIGCGRDRCDRYQRSCDVFA